jgi:hypothetical protein
MAVPVLALYIASGTLKAPYSRHQLIWLVCPLLLYWARYLWLIAQRGKMRHDRWYLPCRTARVAY